MAKKDVREMSDEEIEAWREKMIDKEFVGEVKEHHTKEIHVMQSPVRREIMTILKEKAMDIKELADKLNLDEKTARYHIQFLEDIFYTKMEGNMVDLTPLGVAYTKHVSK
ncbi:MAG: ArsR family transcriptional regulator [Candidatus Jordarchaeum sp.]|uniref:ArsR family transcriptional regulator n=1 Tax=Candidatus Jordarchaeum sp. TaxID=2823881 RepID=UPI004049F6F7